MKNVSYRWYLVGLVLLVQSFTNVDRLALGILTQDIKHDLSLSDSEMGLLDGLAFAVVYAVMGIVIARWADRGNRARMLSVAIALWGAAMLWCSAARGFAQLALTRVLSGVGQAGGDATINSLVPDQFGRTERVRAMTITLFSNPIGGVLGYGAAGWIGQHYGWRPTFLVLGLVGVVLTFLAALTVREPRTALAPHARASAESRLFDLVGFWRICAALWKNVSFRHMAISDVVQVFFANAIYAWLPTFFIRSYGMQTDELGAWIAVTSGVAAFASTYLGGELAHRFLRHNEPLQLKWMAITTAFSTIMLFAVFLSHNRYAALGFMTAFIVLLFLSEGPFTALELTVVPARMRATSAAVVSLLSSLIGVGLGPLAGGALSDLLHPWFGEESLRYALLALTPGYLWCAWHTWAPHKTVLHDARMAEVDLEEAPEPRIAIRYE